MKKSWILRAFVCSFLWAFTALATENRDLEVINVTDAMPLSSQGDGTYPRITHLMDGGLLATFTRVKTVNNRRENRIVVSRSDDQGANWQEIGEVVRSFQDVDNVFPLQLTKTAPGGSAARLLVAFRNHTRDEAGGLTDMRITICRSDDNGKSWAFHSEVDLSQRKEGTWEPFLLDAPDGSLHVYYARERGGPQDIVMKRSFDGGITWSRLITVASQGQARDGMPAVVPFREASGREGLFVIYESGLDGRYTVQGSRSFDGGLSWQQRELVYAAPKPFNAGAPQVARLSNGILVVSFMTDEGQAQQKWPKHAATKVVFADVANGSWNWTGKFTVVDADSFWPGLLASDDGGFYATYDQKGARLKRFEVRKNN